jgi:hypothetical protein
MRDFTKLARWLDEQANQQADPQLYDQMIDAAEILRQAGRNSKLAKREPTQTMVAAGRFEMQRYQNDPDAPARVWVAMWNALPK